MPTIASMTALGSSFAAGPGLPPLQDRVAGRSTLNYPHLVAGALGADLVDTTVSGATTEHLLRRSQRVGLRRFPPQVQLVSPTTDLVTITAGGNDLAYLAGLTTAALDGWLSSRSLPAPLTRALRRPLRARAGAPLPDDAALERATAGLADVVAVVRRRAPRARILLVDYLTILGAGSRPAPELPLTREAIAQHAQVGHLLAAVFASAAQRCEAELVRVSALSADHAVGSPAPWVGGFTAAGLVRGRPPFHPTAAGMRAVAEAVVAHLA